MLPTNPLHAFCTASERSTRLVIFVGAALGVLGAMHVGTGARDHTWVTDSIDKSAACKLNLAS